MSPNESEKLDKIQDCLDDICETQEQILSKQKDIDERLEEAEKVTDPALKLASRIGNKLANALSYGIIIGFITFILWITDLIGFNKLIKIFK